MEQATGRFTVILEGPAATAAIPPVPPLPERPPTPRAPATAPRAAGTSVRPVAPPTVPPLPSPSPSPTTATAPPPAEANPPARPKTPPPSAWRPVPGEASSALPARDLERYKRQVAPTLDRLRLQQPLLMSLEGSGPRLWTASSSPRKNRAAPAGTDRDQVAGEPPVTARHAVPVDDVGADGAEADARGRAHVRPRGAAQRRVGGRRRDAAPQSRVRGCSGALSLDGRSLSRERSAPCLLRPPTPPDDNPRCAGSLWRGRAYATGSRGALNDREDLRADADGTDPGASGIRRHGVARGSGRRPCPADADPWLRGRRRPDAAAGRGDGDAACSACRRQRRAGGRQHVTAGVGELRDR